MSANDAPDVKRTMDRGFLPENLPSVINSKELWPHFTDFNSSYQITTKRSGRVSPYNASKRGFQRRMFGIPHPLFVHDQAAFLVRHWDTILPKLEEASGSLSRPSFPVNGPRSTKITPHSLLPRARLEAFSRFKFCLVTDVSRCFPSIYTHSIPWAIHGKADSKEDTKANSATVFGNRLDFAVRQAQDRQTIGIPVGPDTSRIISEIILSAVDREFIRRNGLRNVTYRRHVDDYWVGGSSIEECDRHLQLLRESLREYELDINELKTRIVNTSAVFGDSWAFEVAEELDEVFPRFAAPRGDQVATLGKILDRARSMNDDGVIRHAIRKLDEHRSWNDHWSILEHFLAQCAVHYPHSFDYVARVVAWRQRKGLAIDTALWTDVIRQVAGEAATLGRDSEVLWSLWLMKELDLKLNKSMSSLMIRTNSPIVSGFIAHMHAHGLTTDRQIRNQLWDRVEGNHFTGQTWPLTLELMKLGFAKPPALDDGGGDDIVKRLHMNGGSLIDWDAVPAAFERPARPDNNNPFLEFDPDEAIEDYTSDYDDDEEDDDSNLPPSDAPDLWDMF